VNKYAEALSYAEKSPDSVRESFTKEEISWALKKTLISSTSYTSSTEEGYA